MYVSVACIGAQVIAVVLHHGAATREDRGIARSGWSFLRKHRSARRRNTGVGYRTDVNFQEAYRATKAPTMGHNNSVRVIRL